MNHPKNKKPAKPSTLKDVQFKVSSFCNHGECVGVARLQNGTVALQDTKDTSQKPLSLTYAGWRTFVSEIKNGEFDQLSHN